MFHTIDPHASPPFSASSGCVFSRLSCLTERAAARMQTMVMSREVAAAMAPTVSAMKAALTWRTSRRVMLKPQKAV